MEKHFAYFGSLRGIVIATLWAASLLPSSGAAVARPFEGTIAARAGAYVPARAQAVAQETDSDGRIRRLRTDFELAEQTFNSVDQPDSMSMFGRIIAGLLPPPAADGTAGAVASDVERGLLIGSLAYRARASFNLGADQEAAADVRALLRIDPGATVDRRNPSPRFLELFDAIHAEMVGHLELVVSPGDAEIDIDGAPVEKGPGGHPLLAGDHSIALRRPGHRPVLEEVHVTAGTTARFEHDLVRTNAVVRVLTHPVGAQVRVDERELGTTVGEAPADFVPSADAAALVGSDFSAELIVDGLLPGAHRVEVATPGYRPRLYELEVAELADYRAVVVLEKTAGTVVLDGMPPGAQLLVDGVPTTPRVGGEEPAAPSLSLSPGRHTVEVIGGAAGVFSGEVEVLDRDTQALSVRLRPGLVLLGVLGGDERGARDLKRSLTATLAAAGSWSLLDRRWPDDELDDVGLRSEILRGAAEEAGGGLDWAAIQAAADRRTPGAVYMLAVLDDDLLATSADLWIWAGAPGPPSPDRVRVGLDDAGDLAELAGALAASASLRAPWLGALLVDVGDVAMVADVTPEGPAHRAGLRAGDEIVSIAGEADLRAAGIRRLVEQSTVGAAISIRTRRDAGELLEVVLGETPVVISPADPKMIYSVMSAALAAGGVADNPDWIIELNRVAVLLHAGAWAEAVRALRGIEGAPSGAGLGQATVEYWLGIALTSLGPSYRERAVDAFQRAAAETGARLYHNDGPLVAPRARARLVELGGR